MYILGTYEKATWADKISRNFNMLIFSESHVPFKTVTLFLL